MITTQIKNFKINHYEYIIINYIILIKLKINHKHCIFNCHFSVILLN